MYRVMVITVSDRASRGERADASGPAVQAALRDAGYAVEPAITLVADEQPEIEGALRRAATAGFALVVTTGGTGFAPRDVTPEATRAVCEKLAPGIPEAMRYASLQITPRACLSRAVAGICGQSLIVNLPGSPKAAIENLSAVLPALGHGLAMLRGGPADCAALPDENRK